MEVSLSDDFLKKTLKILETNEYFVTCYECNKYYVVPTIAPCGHILCYLCWLGRKSCPHCEKKIDKKSLKLNLVMQNLTKHILNLHDVSKDIVGPRNRFMSNIESNKSHEVENVNEWLINSQNHFSECVMEESISKITPTIGIVNDIHVEEKNKKVKSGLVDQRDWDNIEELPNSEDISNKDKENIIGPMDIDPYNDLQMVEEGSVHSMDFRRRSSRNKNIYLKQHKQESGSLNQSKKIKKNNTIKNMKQEFNKLNKNITNKLNVFVEMPKTIENCKNNLLENCNITNLDKVYSFKEIEETNKGKSGDIKDSINEENVTRKNNEINNILASNNKQEVRKKSLNPPGMHIKSVSFIKLSSLNSQMEQSEYFKKILNETVNTDEVEITIKVGDTVTSICINKKEHDIKVSEKLENIHNKINASTSPLQKKTQKKLANKSVQVSLIENSSQTKRDTENKKNTASTDTSTFITQTKKSVERQVRSTKENEEMEDTNKSLLNTKTEKVSKLVDNADDDEHLNVYMFDNKSVKEHNVQSLSRLVHTHSAIFTPSNISKSQNKRKNRERDDSQFEAPRKKCRITESISQNNRLPPQKSYSKSGKYDFISQVSANIENLKVRKENTEGDILQKIIPATNSQKSGESQIENFDHKPIEQKHSENIFSLLDNESELEKINEGHKTVDLKETSLKTVCIENNQSQVDHEIDIEMSTSQNNDDSDKSIVETPQKDISYAKSKQIYTSKITRRELSIFRKQIESKSDTTDKSTVTVIETKPLTVDTPVSIYKFVNDVQHKSTPTAKKSLNFNEADQIICPFVAANIREKEIMDRAFEDTTKTEISQRDQYCLVTSCLSPSDIDRVKLLCTQKNWNFVKNFTNNVTHLIVGVTENNIAQRSIKFISALAASTWIVSMKWIEKCLHSKDIANEEPYEVLDISGEPGPRRSRLARNKLFAGIKFYCMPPFSVLNIDNLKEILLSAGGEVMADINDIKATESPSILLAEPDDTQEDRFIDLAVRMSVVPVHLEWIIESLSYYTLSSIGSQLLCPSSLLPPCTIKWPFAFNISQDSIDD